MQLIAVELVIGPVPFELATSLMAHCCAQAAGAPAPIKSAATELVASRRRPRDRPAPAFPDIATSHQSRLAYPAAESTFHFNVRLFLTKALNNARRPIWP